MVLLLPLLLTLNMSSTKHSWDISLDLRTVLSYSTYKLPLLKVDIMLNSLHAERNKKTLFLPLKKDILKICLGNLTDHGKLPKQVYKTLNTHTQILI